ncbi:MAG: alanyl-tRNA editing protein [Gemmatimonadaceae bacterium]|nr:alanyl-tRNA editing protein [Gemmatimonadaceae bacterium]
MTERLYYTDALRTHFTGTVVAVEHQGHHVVLDQTAFYPTSGGQPFDTGRLATSPVVDVIDEDTRIVHMCAEPTTLRVGDLVDGEIDWVRRFDHMQQHTGQHLLSAILADQYGWPTVSVHFGAVTNTVDVAAEQVPAELLVEIEAKVNDAVYASHSVSVSFEDAAQAVGLRKASDRSGTLRVVTIDGLDRSACGGTHVSNTGAIGSVLLRRVERTKGHTRIEFVCGRRAVAIARADAGLLAQSARLFTAAADELPSLIASQQARVAELEKERKQLSTELAAHRAASIWQATAPSPDGVRRCDLGEVGGTVRDAEPLALALLELGRCMVLATSALSKSVLFAAAPASGSDAGALLRVALQQVGGRGGGSPRVAQGSVPEASLLGVVAGQLGFMR